MDFMGLAKLLLRFIVLSLAVNIFSAAEGEEAQLSFKDANFAQQLAQTDQAHLAAVPLDTQQTADLELEKFQVFAPNAQIIVKNATTTTSLTLPQTSYFKGKVSDQINSAAFMAVDADGNTRSIVQINGQMYINNSWTEKANAFSARAIDPKRDFKQKAFACGTDGEQAFKAPLPAGIKAKLRSNTQEATNTTGYNADLIIETDYEFYSLFNDSTAAAKYVSDLIAYVSSLYMEEINTKLRISKLVLYTSTNDPWNADSTSGALYELQSYYAANYPSTKRTAVHFMSGKDLNGGIAFVDSICTAPAYAGASQGAYDYGVSTSMSGSFTTNSPLIAWDAYVVAHELGHNFGSAHTHAYDLEYDYTTPIDCCYSQGAGVCQNYQPGVHLPGLGTLTGGTTATHPGTIMSYCHIVSGGGYNVTMTFGTNHPYGVEASRVPYQMRRTVETYASAYPACLTSQTVTQTQFGFAKVSKWHESYVAQTATPFIGDFNGDHIDDVASFAQNTSHKVFVALSTGSTLSSKTLWKTDFALGTGQAAVGDFNGDGKTDLIDLTHNANRQMYVALSTGTSFDTNTLWFGTKSAQDGTQIIGDFNGDGKDDVATLVNPAGSIFVNLSAGNRFRVQQQWSLDAALGAQKLVIGDFNGDGKDDLGFSTSAGEVKVSLSTGTSFAAATVWHANLATKVSQLVAGDFNADGKDDIASYLQTAEGGIYVALAESGKFGLNQKAHAWFAPYDQILKAGLFTNDKASDVMTFTRGTTADIWVATDFQ